jgi:hypothetical protein
MGGLFGDIVSMCAVGIFPGASIVFSEYGIQRLLDTRRFDVPSTKVKLDNRDEAFERVIVLGHRK